jgi:hypothetical protein
MPKADTSSHVRSFLRRVDPDYRLLAVAHALRDPDLEGRKDKKGELRHWCREQIKNISGQSNIRDGIQHAGVRTLLAFAYLTVPYAPAVEPPSGSSTKTPDLLKALEPDFLSALLNELQAKSRNVPTFKERLEQAERHVLSLAGTLSANEGLANASQKSNPSPAMAAMNDGWRVVNVLAVIFAVAYVVGKLTKKKT